LLLCLGIALASGAPPLALFQVLLGIIVGYFSLILVFRDPVAGLTAIVTANRITAFLILFLLAVLIAGAIQQLALGI
jgi:hypothetical protein